MRVRALALVSVASLASLVLLTACGGDDKDKSSEAQTFCSVVAPIQGVGTALENTDDTAALKSAMTSAESALAAVGATPPQGIASDVTTVQSIFAKANTALKASNYDIEAAGESDPEAINAIMDPQFQSAADNIQKWSTSNCG
jgi:hypothetical protein